LRAVFDPNVLISAVLSPEGAPAQALRRWFAGEFELIVSAALLEELERPFAYAKLRARISPADAAAFAGLLRGAAIVAPDPGSGSFRSSDPGDDYLLALAESERAHVVTGDRHLLALGETLPVVEPRSFLDLLPG
jgi:hypothetical protein